MRGGSRSGAGRKAIDIDLVDLEKLASVGCTEPEIAGFFNVSVRTIEQRRAGVARPEGFLHRQDGAEANDQE